MAVIETTDIEKTYHTGKLTVDALKGISIKVESGEFVTVMGPSGSGKSTLMNILGCLDRPTGGRYELEGEDVSEKSDGDLAAVRNRKLGFVFQTFNLLPRLTALQNVALPLIYRGVGSAERRRRATEALGAVGLGHRLQHHPNELSGGQQQRVAVARAMVGEPAIILADEPTGNLDTRSGEELMQLFQRLNRDEGATIIQVTHDEMMAKHTERIITLRDGLLRDDAAVEEPLDAAEVLAALPEEGEDGASRIEELV